MESNNRRNVFAHDNIDYLLGSIIVTYPFPIIVLSTLSQGLLCIYIRDVGYWICRSLWIGLPPSCIRDDKWTLGESLTHSQSDNMYEHVRRLWKPCDTMENDKKWKRHNRRDDERLLSGWGLENWNVCTLLAAQIINLARVGQNKHWSPHRISSLCISRESLGRQTMKINAVFVFSTLFISLTQRSKT